MDEAVVRRVVERYFAALDAEDLDGLRAVFAPDVRLRPVGSRPRAGADAVLAFYGKVFERFPDHHDTPTRVIVAGSTAVAEIAFRGRSAGGAAVAFDALDVFDLDPLTGRIEGLSQWFDTAELARQLAD